MNISVKVNAFPPTLILHTPHFHTLRIFHTHHFSHSALRTLHSSFSVQPTKLLLSIHSCTSLRGQMVQVFFFFFFFLTNKDRLQIFSINLCFASNVLNNKTIILLIFADFVTASDTFKYLDKSSFLRLPLKTIGPPNCCNSKSKTNFYLLWFSISEGIF